MIKDIKLLKKNLPKMPWPNRKMPLIIMKETKFKAGYIVRIEIEDAIEYMGKPYKKNAQSIRRFLVMRKAYTPEGDWIGSPKEARFFIVKKSLSKIQKTKPDHCICSIGFNEKEQKWYGWSHRAMCGFGIGDKIFMEKFGNDKTKFTQHGRTTINFMKQAKIAATRFARSVS